MFKTHFKVSDYGKVSVEFVYAVTLNTRASYRSRTWMSKYHIMTLNKGTVTKMLLGF